MDRPTEPVGSPGGGSLSVFEDLLEGHLGRLRGLAEDLDATGVSSDRIDALYREINALGRAARAHGVHELARLGEALKATLAGLSAKASPADRELLRLGLARLEASAEAWTRRGRSRPEVRPEPGNHAVPEGGWVLVDSVDTAIGAEIARKLQARGFRTDDPGTGSEDGTVAPAGLPPAARVVCFGEVLPDSPALTRLREPGQGFLPTLAVARYWNPGARLQAVREGAARCLDYPLADETLLEQLAQIGGVVTEAGYQVLIVGGESDEALVEELRGVGLEADARSDPDTALARVHGGAVEVLVLDADASQPGCRASEFTALLRTRDNGSTLPVMMLTEDPARINDLMALHPGTCGVFLKPVRPRQLADAIAAHARQQRQKDGVSRAYRQALYEREREHLAVNEHALVSITDVAGDIIYANERFARVSGYAVSELLGCNHRLLKSGMHPDAFYTELWETIASGRIWQGEVCNRARDGSLYWVETTVVPYLDGDGLPYQYVSIRTDITTVKRQEHRLRSSQVFTNMGTWEWTPGREELEWSERIAPLLGYQNGDLAPTEDNFLAAVHPEDRERVRNAIRSSMRRGAYLELEHRVVWPDGTVRWLLQRGDVERDAAGDVLHMLGVMQDITKRKQSELALAEQTGRLREAQRLARVGHWEYEPESGRLGWSDIVYELFDLSPGNGPLSMEAFRDYVHPEDLEHLDAALEQARGEGRGESVLRIRRPGGDRRHMQLIAHQKPSGENPDRARLTGTLQDVTELQQAQEELSLFRRIFEASEQAISIADREGFMIYNNPSALEMTGYAEADLAGRPYRELIPEEAAQAGREIDEIRHAGGAWTGQLPIRCRNGAVIMTRSTVGVVRDRRGDPQYIFNIFSDFTAELQRRAELDRAREEAEQASRAKSDFLSNMSHELRTPMNAILGFAQLLQRDPVLGERQRGQLDEISRAGRHLLELINEILDLARIESGRMQVAREPVDVAGVVRECGSLMGPLAEERDIRLAGIDAVAAQAPRVLADRTRVKQVLLNLLSNAVKYNHEGGCVTLEVTHEDAMLRLGVRDDGPGLSQEQQERLFQPFERLEADQGGIEGSGVGLTITRHLVTMMNGRLGLESAPGEGALFWFELPLADGADATANADGAVYTQGPGGSAPGSGDSGASGDSGTPRSVLCIDDQAANLRLLEDILGQEPDLRPVLADTPLKGIEEATRTVPDVILLDLAMPGMDGYQVLRALRADETLAQVPVLAVTADATGPTRERALQAGFAEVITKPVDPAGLRERVREIAGDAGQR
ncbi:PAS domain-containing protein [Thioalkalivibrio sp. ALJ24]|uniref:PAS domain-containing protein n=1 Tax=Thioalkalivibrio sp. ALJ24 TaxID=545276 RepID=UPI000366468B|nr:PAS domain-containing protein [Thioalkalivibrio sp. ALJ24]